MRAARVGIAAALVALAVPAGAQQKNGALNSVDTGRLSPQARKAMGEAADREGAVMMTVRKAIDRIAANPAQGGTMLCLDPRVRTIELDTRCRFLTRRQLERTMARLNKR